MTRHPFGRVGNRLAEIAEALVLLAGRSTFRLDSHDRRHIYLEIGEDKMQRTLRRFLVLLQTSGCHVFLHARPSRRTMANARLLKWYDNVSLIWRAPAGVRPSVLWTDRVLPVDSPERRRYGKVMHVGYDYRPRLPLAPSHFAVPMSMHPQVYEKYRDHLKLVAYRRSERRTRGLFAGAWNSPGYDKPIMSDLYGIESRYRIVRFLRDSGSVKLIRTEPELTALLAGGYCDEFVLLDGGLRIDQARWLKLLSQADFFLCPPGVSYPPSHNAVEAMAVGTIPLINYPQWFSPPLCDGVNCVTFATLDDLKRAIARIQAMGEGQISQMRQCVLAYYEQHLDADVVARRWLDDPAKDVFLHMSEDNDAAMRRALSI